MTALGVTDPYRRQLVRARQELFGRDRSQSAVSSRTRVGWIDGARGLSIVWMIIGHTVAFLGIYIDWFEYVVMRPVAPMFLLLLGMLWRPGFRRRHVQFLAGMLAAQLLAALLGFLAFPNILVLMGGALLVMPIAARWPMATVALCVTQLNFWPMPDWWTGYHPGFVVALVLVGHCIADDGLVRAFGQLGSRLGLEVVGRYPLTFYLGHLAVFLAITGAL